MVAYLEPGLEVPGTAARGVLGSGAGATHSSLSENLYRWKLIDSCLALLKNFFEMKRGENVKSLLLTPHGFCCCRGITNHSLKDK